MTPRTQREIAIDLLTRLFRTETRISLDDVREAAEAEGVSFRTLSRAASAMGTFKTIHNGQRPAIWEKKEEEE